jgi:hypothetical protein
MNLTIQVHEIPNKHILRGVVLVQTDNNNNNLLPASGLSPGGSGYFTFKLRQTY